MSESCSEKHGSGERAPSECSQRPRHACRTSNAPNTRTTNTHAAHAHTVRHGKNRNGGQRRGGALVPRAAVHAGEQLAKQ
eukprot:EC816789.1.p3 GENE.EC816789.1~~EC816789.1.p3  ORF type:complete len:80 (+),score=5.13 EC816789.1:393-632(+)